MHWGFSYLREDIQDLRNDVRQELRSIRDEFRQELRETREEFRQELRDAREDRQDLRKELLTQINVRFNFAIGTMITLSAVLAALIKI